MRSVKDTFLWLAEKFGRLSPGPSLKVLAVPSGWIGRIDIKAVFHLIEEDFHRLGFSSSEVIWHLQKRILEGHSFGPEIGGWTYFPTSKRRHPDIGLFWAPTQIPKSLFEFEEVAPAEGSLLADAYMLVEEWNSAFEKVAIRAGIAAFPRAYPRPFLFTRWLELLAVSRYGNAAYWDVVDYGGFWGPLEWTVLVANDPTLLSEQERWTIGDPPFLPCPIFTYIPDVALLSEEICRVIAEDGYIAEDIQKQVQKVVSSKDASSTHSPNPVLPIIKMEETSKKNSQKTPAKSWWKDALAKIELYPELADYEIADLIGIARSTIYRDVEFRREAAKKRQEVMRKYAACVPKATYSLQRDTDGEMILDGETPAFLPEDSPSTEHPETETF